VLIVIALGLAVLGFGQAGDGDRVSISGTITVDGKPLDQGTIRFYCEDRSPFVAAGSFLKAGEYSIPRSAGLVPGKYKILISGLRDPSNPALWYQAGTDASVTAEEPLPAQYNRESNLFIEIKEGGRHSFDFDLAL
jgi:hypothetical protein